MAAKEAQGVDDAAREPVLSVVDRISEMLFGLFMALTFVGAVSVTESGNSQVKSMFAAALGCNLAWGLVDAVMYLVRTVQNRGRQLTIVHAVRAAPDAAAGRKIIEGTLSQALATLVSSTEVEGIRARIVALASVPARPRIRGSDLLATLAIFLIVVLSTFPVVLPFLFISDLATAKSLSRGIALAMLFGGGFALGRDAGYGGWRAGLAMTGLGTALVVAINALGG